MNNKHESKRVTNIVYWSLMGIGILLTIIRWISAFHNHILVINQDVNSHINNFSFSLIFYLVVGFMWILQGVEFKKIILLGIVIIVGNILCETVMGFMNTTDIIDAVYGIVATALIFCFLLITKKYGLR
ncbi:MAG: hypothetical protein RR585_11755 [Coprobacillus sp.]